MLVVPEQLGRATRGPTDAEREAIELVPGIVRPAPKLLGAMESRGWRRSAPGYVDAYLRAGRTADGAPVELRAELEPGIEIAHLRHVGDVRVASVAALLDGDEVPLGQLSPVTFSELVRDLEALR